MDSLVARMKTKFNIEILILPRQVSNCKLRGINL